MKIADLYIRVSTDEQADKGYSQRSQEEVLRKYCDLNKIGIRKTIFEDHSAKTFIRPEWQTLLVDLKKSKNKTDLILFTKWDRFSRNAPEAYQMINILKKFGVEPQAIEQPLDMNVPENKIMLAIYLTTPEVENDRRSLNVFYGMRRARKEGRWMASAPVGYINRTMENGSKKILLHEPQASIMKWAFKEISSSRYTTEQVWRKARELGLSCNKNNFWLAIRNPVYCGKIVIPKFKDEESHIVDGIHEPLITQCLFYDVQDVLNGRGKKPGTKMVSSDMLPLRGYLSCPRCSKILSGSASKGRKEYYHYYHCSSSCGYRLKAEDVNNAFNSHLKDFVLNPPIHELFKAVIVDSYSNVAGDNKDARKELIDQVTILNNKISKARELLLCGDIDGADYKLIKTENETKILAAEARISSLNDNVISVKDVSNAVDEAVDTLAKLDLIYLSSDTYIKRKIIGSIYPEKFTFSELSFRTAQRTEIFDLIYLINKELHQKNNGTIDKKSSLSRWVFLNGFEPLSSEPESDMLPLHHRKIYYLNGRRANIKKIG